MINPQAPERQLRALAGEARAAGQAVGAAKEEAAVAARLAQVKAVAERADDAKGVEETLVEQRVGGGLGLARGCGVSRRG